MSDSILWEGRNVVDRKKICKMYNLKLLAKLVAGVINSIFRVRRNIYKNGFAPGIDYRGNTVIR